ncbi:hypothetical protein NGTWS0302_32970 [Mycolicibacterium cyprinidarum]|uniref:DUF222 domain-containing protein n=1 Tax=Mycolicibacterium cyprinidarum TaxID=2860311 RepID=A0ABQ4V516_9MYCO|nr:hypothetical protein NGTWS1702_31870 [Mycolicibacterium sp. NGTWSNA01]GJF13104.1 hypothetical protein NGTWS0302_32970 [Mycolicibacterium sp. NGTWS0302]
MPDIDRGRHAWNFVASLCNALGSGEHSIGTVPLLLKRVLKDELWREFTTPGGGVVRHSRFEDFVTSKPTRGLGASLDLVRRIVSDDKEAVDLLDQALQGRNGGDHTSPASSLYNIQTARAPSGNSEAAALRRLRKDRPDLHQRVIDGELTAHAAAVEAGHRPAAVTVRVTSPESIARTLRKHLPPDLLAEVIGQLAQHPDPPD